MIDEDIRKHPIGYALADYLRTGNVQALMMVLDVEWDAREWAKGELDRALTGEDVCSRGFEPLGKGSFIYWVRVNYSVQVFAYLNSVWGWCAGDNKIVGEITTLRQFMHLCGLFGISPSS
jgi:hypothetical protein